ncbi:MAG TPA: 4'-phosphopantetheinyl transferase superfamily protein [Arenimonas sp.]|nr:4'-phosphopantetheinyl transferase superfamily protein [Arenimonas sp.]HOZ05383.1 4'-phosphopantetheinyl transferase superfamily protein [Arenimonas sp.]HPW31758.1 4'-phosphopantetheinyl transferase superfamily protein [Arenimonas sp.]
MHSNFQTVFGLKANQAAVKNSRLAVANLELLAQDSLIKDLNWLSEAERVRYHSISSVSRKRQYLAGHYSIRRLASSMFQCSASNWDYHQAASNIRFLRSALPELPDLHVSISHSGKWLAAAVSQSPIGIDIEGYGKSRNWLAIARHIFSEDEIVHLEACESGELEQYFYLYWTMKESSAKQYGLGLKKHDTRRLRPVALVETDNRTGDILHSWQCPEYVLSVSLDEKQNIEIGGLQLPAHHRMWRNLI